MTPQFGASLSEVVRVIIYDCNMFILQATDKNIVSAVSIPLAKCTKPEQTFRIQWKYLLHSMKRCMLVQAAAFVSLSIGHYSVTKRQKNGQIRTCTFSFFCFCLRFILLNHHQKGQNASIGPNVMKLFTGVIYEFS